MMNRRFYLEKIKAWMRKSKTGGSVLRFLYWINPDRCKLCRTPVAFKNPIYVEVVNGAHISVQCTTPKHAICRSCLLAAVNEFFTRPPVPSDNRRVCANPFNSTPVKGRCDVLRENRLVAKILELGPPYGNLHICLSYWNGFYLCQEVLQKVISFGDERSNNIQWSRNKPSMWYVNHRGVPIKGVR